MGDSLWDTQAGGTERRWCQPIPGSPSEAGCTAEPWRRCCSSWRCQPKVGELGIEIPRPLLAYLITPQCLTLVTQTQKPKSKGVLEMSFPASLTKDREEIWHQTCRCLVHVTTLVHETGRLMLSSLLDSVKYSIHGTIVVPFYRLEKWWPDSKYWCSSKEGRMNPVMSREILSMGRHGGPLRCGQVGFRWVAWLEGALPVERREVKL